MSIMQLFLAQSSTAPPPAPAVVIVGLDPYGVALTPADATATYRLTNTGLEQATSRTDSTWLLSGSASDFDVRMTVTSGTLTSGTVGSWVNLAATQEWTLVRGLNIPGVLTAEATVELRPAGGGATVDSAVVTFEAEVI